MPYKGDATTNNKQSLSEGPPPWLGFQEVACVGFVDRKVDSKYDNLDVFLEVHLQNDLSQYPYKYNLLGTFDKDTSGKIDGGSSLLKHINYLSGALLWDGGVDVQGNWVTADDEPIDDIQSYLTKNYAQDFDKDKTKSIYCFVYDKWSVKAKRSYQTVCPKMVVNTPDNQRDLHSYIDYMKANGYIKEHDANQPQQAKVITNGVTANANTTF